MQEDRIKQLEPKESVTTQLNEYMDQWHKQFSVWSEPCRSWYKDNLVDGRVYIWSGSLLHFLKTIKKPRFEHYEIEYKDDNAWRRRAWNWHRISEMRMFYMILNNVVDKRVGQTSEWTTLPKIPTICLPSRISHHNNMSAPSKESQLILAIQAK
jgi:hypothetical protein